MKRYTIITQRQATYFTFGDYNKATTLWFVLHGYGMLSEYFIRYFYCLNQSSNRHFVIAPEALSRFYLSGTHGRVGSSWMTKESREEEVQDYIFYLDKLYKKYYDSKFKVNVLGFSQGTATLSRWLCNGDVKPSCFILWAGDFSNDMEFEKLSGIESYLIVGKQDKYVTPLRMEKAIKKLKAVGLKYTFDLFDGGHTIPELELTRLTKKNNW